MPLPAGLVLEENLNAPKQTTDIEPPPGLVLEGNPQPQIRQAPPKGMMDKLFGFFRDEDKYIARAANIYALSEATGLPLNEVNKNYDIMRRSANVTGLESEPTEKEVMQGLLLPG